MAVDDGVLVRKEFGVVAVQEDAAGKIVLFLKGTVQVIAVILSLGNGIGQIQRADAHPSDDIRVDGIQVREVDGIAQERQLFRLAVLHGILSGSGCHLFLHRPRIFQFLHVLQNDAAGCLGDGRTFRLGRAFCSGAGSV